jgi:PAS domain-containing protein
VEAEPWQNEARLDAVLEAASDGLLVLADTSAGAVVRMTNRAFAEQFDLTVERLLGANEADLARLLRELRDGAEDVAAFLASGIERKVEAVALHGRRPA